MKKCVYIFLMVLPLGYMANAQNRVGIGTTTPLAMLHVADSIVLFSGNGTLSEPYPDLPIKGSGIRMLWYPGKAAFRAGHAITGSWDGENIGPASVAMGYGTEASGLVSFSMGTFSSARGVGAISMGGSNTSIGTYATSFGFASFADGNYATSMGYYTQAKAVNSTTLGAYNNDSDNPSRTNPNANDRIFQIGNGSSNNDRRNAITVLRNGNMGIGVLNPGYLLDINGRMRLRSGNNLSAGIDLNNDNNSAVAAFVGKRSNNDEIGFYGQTGTNGWRLLVNTTTGNAWLQGTLSQNSDARLKTNIVQLSSTLPAIQQLNGYTYHWKDASNPEKQIGLLAQELRRVYPQLVTANENGELSVNYSGMVPILLEAIKELQQRIIDLEKKLK